MKRTNSPAQVGRKALYLLFILSLLLSLTASAMAQSPGGEFQTESLAPDSLLVSGALKPNAQGLVSVIVKLDFEPAARLFSGAELESLGAQAYLANAEAQIAAFEAAALAAIPAARVVHRYPVVIGGASLILPADQVAALAGLSGVVAVYADTLEQVLTENSPAFIGAPTLWDELGGLSSAGEGVIVGILDTGIWPEHPSLADPDPAGNPYPAPPAQWAGTACEFGSDDANDPDFECNNKLIGAARFLDTFDEFGPAPLPGEFMSARDNDGHGTHTATTAAGNGGVAASIQGSDLGLVTGIAPRARVSAYKVCWANADTGSGSCYSSDSAAAVQQAILDGVDVINFSIGGGVNPYADVVSLAFLDAYHAGVFVAASAGNSGPGADTVSHREPWVTTVAASTQDRAFANTLTVTGTVTSGETGEVVTETLTLPGVSLTGGYSGDVILAADVDGLPEDDAEKGMCNQPFPEGTFDGEIVVCKRGVIARVEKGYNVLVGGAGGYVLYNPALQGLSTDNHFLPATHIEVNEGAALLAFLAGHEDVTGAISAGAGVEAQGDVMAAFSSRGGPGQTLGISKPDVTAPGVQILAGHSPFPNQIAGGSPGELFQAIGGTSMSSPHVAGAAALVKALHPNWTPGQIRSALMTTAKTTGVVKENGTTAADPFDYGSGRIDLDHAGFASLTFSAPGQDYINHQNALWDVNYPSIYIPSLAGKITVQRSARSHVNGLSTWAVSVVAPDDLKISAPSTLMVLGGSDAPFDVGIDASMVPHGQVRHAWIVLSRGAERHHLPVTIVRRHAPVTLDKTCTPASFALGDATDCTVTLTNAGFADAVVQVHDFLPKALELVAGSAQGAAAAGNDLVYTGSLFAAEPPEVEVIDGTDTTPAGYLPLSGFNVAPISGVTDETIVNFNVPGFVFGGETYTRIGMVSNGYAVVGGGVAADIQFLNQELPDPARPNNVLAPFWTDLNPAAGGGLRAGILSGSGMRWLVLDWESVPNFGDRQPNSFQLWIGLNGVEDISFTYGAVTGGDDGLLTVGAENKFGNRGSNWYYNGAGTAPAADDELRVVSLPAAAGETHTITYQARGAYLGAWTNTVEMTSAAFPGVSVAVASGEVVEPSPPDVTVTLPLLADTWVNGGVGEQNTNNNTFAALIARTTGLDNIFLTFDRSMLPQGAQILAAELTVQVSGQSGAFGKSLTAMNTNPFDTTTITYNNAPGAFNPSAAVAVPDAPGAMSFDVASQIAAWDALGAQAVTDAHLGQLAISASGPPGRVIVDSLETFAGSPATLTVTYRP